MIMVIRWNRLPSCTLLLILTWILYLGSFDNAWAQQKTGDAVAAGAQSDDSLDLRGDVPNPRLVSAAELHKLPRAEMRTTDPDNSGNEIVYSGTPLIEVLKADGLLFDSGMARIRQAVTITLLVEAADGYRAVFALAELDPELTIVSFYWQTPRMASRFQLTKDRFALLFLVKNVRRAGCVRLRRLRFARTKQQPIFADPLNSLRRTSDGPVAPLNSFGLPRA
jgi:hypothetical protein